MANQTAAPDLAAKFAPAAALLAANEDRILEELAVGSHAPADVGGYFKVDTAKADAVRSGAAGFSRRPRAEASRTQVMRPSPTFNAIIDSLAGSSIFVNEDVTELAA